MWVLLLSKYGACSSKELPAFYVLEEGTAPNTQCIGNPSAAVGITELA